MLGGRLAGGEPRCDGDPLCLRWHVLANSHLHRASCCSKGAGPWLPRSHMLSLLPVPGAHFSSREPPAPVAELKGKLNGLAIRVPLLNGSLTDCVFEVQRDTSVEEVNALLKVSVAAAVARTLCPRPALEPRVAVSLLRVQGVLVPAVRSYALWRAASTAVWGCMATGQHSLIGARHQPAA